MRFLLAILLLLLAAPASAQQGQGLSNALVVSSCGGQTLPTGPQTNLTMNPQGQLCLVGIAPGGFCGAATAYLARTVGGNEGGNAANIAALICGLVSDGIITGSLSGATSCGVYLDGLWILAQQNQTDALLNLCGTSYGLTNVSSVPFTTYVGFGPFSATFGFLRPTIDVSLGGFNYIRNSANAGLWTYAATVETNGEMNDGANIDLRNNYNGAVSFFRVNDIVGGSSPVVGTKGLYVGDRSSSTTTVPYWNGVAQTPVASASTALTTGSLQIGSGYGGVSTQTLSEAHIGGSLGAALNLALYNRLRTYLTAVGVP